MKKIFFLFGILYAAVMAQAQIQEPVKFKSELKTLSDTEVEVVFTATIDNNLYIFVHQIFFKTKSI